MAVVTVGGLIGKCLKRFAFSIIALFVLALPISTIKTASAVDTTLTYNELKAWTEKKQEDEWSAQLVAYSTTLVGKRTGQCVLALRYYFGVPKGKVQGMAKSTKINSTTGKVGAIIVFKNMSRYGHVGIIIKDDGAGWFYFDSNGDNRQRGAIRWIAKNDPRISGYQLN